MSNDVESLKSALTAALQVVPLNYGQVLYLANEIAKQDSENIRFSVDASHISRLGIELVSKQETAVAELIKNAFDSDATVVDVIFANTDTPGGQLEISDNGHGMSRQELVNGFMRISTQDKVRNPRSGKYGRQRAGRKGIGRFAAQRLGRALTIETRQETDELGHALGIDWNLFEGGKDLFLVANEIRAAKKAAIGTTLLIEGVRDSWTEAQIQRTYRYISSLLQPFPLSVAKDGGGADPGFKVTIYRTKDGERQEIAGEEQSIFPHALAKFSGRVDETGIAHVRVTSKKFNIDLERPVSDFDVRTKQKTDSQSKYSELAGIQFNAHYFITDELPSGTKTMVREILNAHGGIRIYRNGFRVLPYGEPFDDWLGMQRSSALREILPPHHNTNFLGFVEILDVHGERFEETASREGLLENPAFLQLQDFLYRGLMAGVLEVARARKRKLYASDPSPNKGSETDVAKKSAHEIAAELREIVRKVETAVATPPPAAPDHRPRDLFQQPAQHAHRISDVDLSALGQVTDLANRIEALGAESVLLLEENGMLRVLASLGLTIGEFTHEVRHTLAGLNSALTSLGTRLDPNGQPFQEFDSLKKNVQLLQSYVRYFDDAVTQNAHRKLEAHEIRDLVADFSEMIKPTLKRQGVSLDVDIKGYDLFTKPTHRSEWASIFLNLFTNSLKAIHRAKSSGKILIKASAVGDFLRIDFLDNGDGIPVGDRGKVFEAFFTTSSLSKSLATDSEKLLGTGLGLKIVRDILDAANGDIEVVEAEPGYSTCFRIEVPLATTE